MPVADPVTIAVFPLSNTFPPVCYTRNRLGLLTRLRYHLLAADPGLSQLKHGAKTVLAVVAALEALRFSGSALALYSGLSAGFLMQSTAGTARRTRQITMGAMGFASTIAVGIGSELSERQWAKQLLLVAAAFSAFYVRRWIHGKAMFPVFAFILTLVATVQPGGAKSAMPMMLAVFTGFLCAFAVYFYVLRDESLNAFRNAAALFLFRLGHAIKHPGKAQADLRVLHRALAFEEEEREHLGELAPAYCAEILDSQYEALQVLVLLFDIERSQATNASSLEAARFSRAYLDKVFQDLERREDLLNA